MFSYTQEVEPCIGCMQVLANTKLVKLCQTGGKRGCECVSMCVLMWLFLWHWLMCFIGADNESECQQCFCRPMWCLSCLGRWFASRQDQQRPETWLSSTVPCPTCRAKFCILDICVLPWWPKNWAKVAFYFENSVKVIFKQNSITTLWHKINGHGTGHSCLPTYSVLQIRSDKSEW